MKKYYYKVFLLFIGIAPIVGHDLWIEKNQDHFELKYGHLYSHSLSDSSPRYLEYKKDNVKKIQCIKNNLIEKVQINKVPVLLPECDIFFIEFSTGFWVQTIEGLKNEHPENVKASIVNAWESIEYLKQIHNWKDNYHQIQNNGLEIVPLENPFLKKIGDKLKIQVFYNNTPVSEIPVAYGEDVRGVTNQEGKFSIRLHKGGYQIIRTTLTIKTNDPKVKQILTSTLIFKL